MITSARGGDVDRRARLVEKALGTGAEHHRAGRWREAAAAYAEALRADPENTDALTLLGGVLLRLERPRDAMALLERAVANAPTHALAWLNLGRARLALGHADAVGAFDRALAERPGFPEARLGRARALLAAGRVEEAVEAARDAPDGPDAAALLGAALTAAGRPAEAGSALRRALAARPNDARLHADHAACLELAGDPEADAAWSMATRLDPAVGARRAALHRDRGLAALAAGDPAAVDALRRALSFDPADRAARVGLADALFQHPDAATSLDLAGLLRADDIDHQRLSQAVEHLVFATEPRLDTPPALLLAWLRRAIAATPRQAAAVTRLRREALARVAAGGVVAPLTLEALARHAWHTDHADVTRDDEAVADAIAAEPATAARLLAFALARPLSAWPRPAELSALSADFAAPLQTPPEERALAAALPSLGAPTDATSVTVRAQYEEHPYPRLVGVHRRAPRPFADYVHAVLPDVPVPSRDRTRVLVAGGGTGQHPIGVAAALADADVVAVDLSRASLGRAARVARDLGVANVRFVQGDLLALGPADGLGAFDFVDCVGVLHHLADPVAGGRALVAKLAPDGLLRLGVYSERGRADVVAARALAAEHGWLPTADGLRAARAALLALPADHPAAGLRASVDLYTPSGLRDLAFHPCEHRFTPAGLADLLDAIGLSALGLQHARPEPARRYAARWPDDVTRADLRRWDALEAEHPRIFAGMIHVWCRRA